MRKFNSPKANSLRSTLIFTYLQLHKSASLAWSADWQNRWCFWWTGKTNLWNSELHCTNIWFLERNRFDLNWAKYVEPRFWFWWKLFAYYCELISTQKRRFATTSLKLKKEVFLQHSFLSCYNQPLSASSDVQLKKI